MKKPSKEGLSVVGVGAAACLVCCGGPILAFLSGLGVAGLASTLVIGAAGLLIAVSAIGAFLLVRRRRSACVVPDGPVSVTLSARSPM